jgi:NAD(P)-dependent dehydrogenase (short-subunit alcohol dehydrogenase family)
VKAPKLFDLTGKTALVTGGGRGLGRQIAIGLAEAGADVCVASRKLANCEETAQRVEALGRRGWAFECDVAKPADIEALADAALAACTRIDVLVNNAGAIWGAPVLEFPLDGWERDFAVNVRGPWLLSQRLARHMAEQGGGSIVHVSSIAGMRGAPDEKEPAVAYAASKGALHALTRDMAVKLAGRGIRVNAIAPGAFDTEMLDYVRGDPEQLAGFLDQIPMRRAGGEDDVKGAAVFLASAASAYVTGHVLVLDGGWFVSA